MKSLILLPFLWATIGCSTYSTRNIASQQSTCEDRLKNNLESKLSDEAIQLCFESAITKWGSIGFSNSSGQPSNSDKAIVSDYVDVWAYLINKALRTGDSAYIRDNTPKLNRLEQSLLKFPIYRGVVFRGSEFPPVKNFEKGTIFKDPAFISTSMDISIAEHYAGVNGYITVILSRSGRILSYDKATEELSGEMEVLFPRDKVFKIFAIQKYKSTPVTLVFLVEE